VVPDDKEQLYADVTELLLEFLSWQAGLLIQRGNEINTFPHRHFQEYLTAYYLAKDYPHLLAELIRREPDPRREVTLLAGSGQGMLYAIWDLVEVLLVKPAPDEGALAENWGALVAGQLVAESVNLADLSSADQCKLKQVRQRQVQIMEQGRLPALERAIAGRILGRIGDPRKTVMALNEMEFCLVPAGEFWMGSEDYINEKLLLDYDYWVSRYPVTNAQFAMFVADDGYQDSVYWDEARKAGVWLEGKVKGFLDDYPREKPYDFDSPFNLPNYPVVGVTWYEALAFTRWLTRNWRRKGLLTAWEIVMLPSESEWEKAARGGELIPATPIIRQLSQKKEIKLDLIYNPQPKREYPWDGSGQFDLNRANGFETGIGGTSAPGCFQAGASPYGVEELSGNVWEWTRSVYKIYPYRPDDGRENLGSKSARVLRGDSWSTRSELLRVSFRLFKHPDYSYCNFGFRVVVCVARIP
jgi:formylglycine-generating enzyme required for sulfatase activity